MAPVSESQAPAAAQQQEVRPESPAEQQVAEAALPKNNLPLGIIAAAVVICLALVSVAVYSALAQA